MVGMPRQQRAILALLRIFIVSAVIAPPSYMSHHARAQETKGDTLLVTSFGTPDIAAPDILPEIFQIKPDGTGRKPLLPKKTWAFDAVLSPDGTQLAFVGSIGGADDREIHLGLFVMRPDGSARKCLTEMAKFDGLPLAPSWSPDGKTIAFCTFAIGFKASSPQRLYIIDAGGQNLKCLDKLEGLNPVWSPDGKRLLFTRMGKDHSTLCAANIDGTDVRLLVKRREKTLIFGAWSPDGKQLAYTLSEEDDRDEPGGLFVARDDGSQAKRLVGGRDEIAFGVRWSSDGKQLFFTRRDRSGSPLPKDEKNPAGGRGWGANAVYATNVDGQKLRRVTAGKEREYIGGNYLFAALTLTRR